MINHVKSNSVSLSVSQSRQSQTRSSLSGIPFKKNNLITYLLPIAVMAMEKMVAICKHEQRFSTTHRQQIYLPSIVLDLLESYIFFTFAQPEVDECVYSYKGTLAPRGIRSAKINQD